MMIPRGLRGFFEADRVYFRSCKAEITAQNNRMLVDGCVSYALVLTFYTALAILTRQPAVLRNMYYGFDVLHAVLCVAVFRHTRARKGDFRSTQRVCALLEWSVLAFFVLEAAYTSQTQHSLYIPIAILLVLLLFTHNAYYTALTIFAYTLSYAVLSCLYKAPEAYWNDLRIAGATLIAAIIGYLLIARLRHNEGALLRRFETLSETDALTGLYNKFAIETLCERRITEQNRPCALMILDIDRFKAVNDDYGHAMGDEVLRRVGQLLGRSFGERDAVGRFGGDEFLALMGDCGDASRARDMAEALAQRISELRFPPDGPLVRCSAGIAVKAGGEDFRAVFRRADRALYEAKKDEQTACRVADDR